MSTSSDDSEDHDLLLDQGVMEGIQADSGQIVGLEKEKAHEEREEESSEDEEEEEDEDSDDDIDAEAEAIARRLGEELMAGLASASAELTAIDSVEAGPAQTQRSKKEQAIILTMTAILTLIENDTLANSSLASAVIPTATGPSSVLDFLKRTVNSGSVPLGIATPLSHVLVSLARSEELFGNLRHSNASSIQLDKGKRKRNEEDDHRQIQDLRAFKRPNLAEIDLEAQMNEAVRAISLALQSSPSKALDTDLVSSIRLQLHQVFLFAMTSSAGGGPDMHVLQEIGGLIQVVGVLSGIQIGQNEAQPPASTNGPYSWPVNNMSPQQTDIGTAVYPCNIPGCRKVFSRLYQLRSHQRLHAAHRPFHCKICPASFARNHDLKRHVKLHENKAWRCGGCLKVFSRRDAIKRHKNSSRLRGAKGEQCIDAEIHEVELDEEGDDQLREERRAKLWTGMANSVPHAAIEALSEEIEEGELQSGIVGRIQSNISSLHALLQAHVSQALGSPQTHIAPADPTAGQATLANVIARAQLQAMPSQGVSEQPTNKILNTVPDTGVTITQVPDTVTGPEDRLDPQTVMSSLSMYGLSDEQAKMLEEAIATAAAAAQAQAEAEAALEEDDDESSSEGSDTDDDDGGQSAPMDWAPA